MSKKPTQKKTPFVIEPLNWVTPAAKRNEQPTRRDDAEQSEVKQGDKN